MLRIKKGDLVVVIAGKDIGKTGKVLRVFYKSQNALIEGINLVKRHMRKRRETDIGGIVQKEAPIRLCNLMLYCKRCGRASRFGTKRLEDGSKIKYCRRCGEPI